MTTEGDPVELAEGPQFDAGDVIVVLVAALVAALVASAVVGVLAAAAGVALARWTSSERPRTPGSPVRLAVVGALLPLFVWVGLFLGLAAVAEGRGAMSAIWLAGPLVALGWGWWYGGRHDLALATGQARPPTDPLLEPPDPPSGEQGDR